MRMRRRELCTHDVLARDIARAGVGGRPTTSVVERAPPRAVLIQRAFDRRALAAAFGNMSDPDISHGACTVRRRARTAWRLRSREDCPEIGQILRRVALARPVLFARPRRVAPTKEKLG
jgi:hypothetical protein